MLAKRSAQVFARCCRPSRARLVLPAFWLAFDLLAGMVVGAAALGVEPVGSQFQVNTYTTGYQWDASVAADAEGNFVVVWESDGSAGSDASDSSIQGQRYDATGNALGSEFQVNTYTTNAQERPSVAADADGSFVVVWKSDGSAGSDSSGSSVQGQRYDASGNALGSEFQVNTYTTGSQRDSSVAADGDGGFVVVWESNGSAGSDSSGLSIQGQRYDASGSPVGSQFQINTWVIKNQADPSVAVDADGDFVVAWSSYAGYSVFEEFHVRGRRYDASGNALGSDFKISTYTNFLNSNMRPSVASDANGDFVVVWSRYVGPAPEQGYYVQGQRYDASGDAVGSEFHIDHPGRSNPTPSVAAGAGGDFVVVWAASPPGGYGSIAGKRYDADANALDTFQANTYGVMNLFNPAVARDANGRFVVVWEGYEGPGSDTSGSSVQGRRFALSTPPPPVPSLSPPGAFGLGLLILGVAAARLRGRLRKRA